MQSASHRTWHIAGTQVPSLVLFIEHSQCTTPVEDTGKQWWVKAVVDDLLTHGNETKQLLTVHDTRRGLWPRPNISPKRQWTPVTFIHYRCSYLARSVCHYTWTKVQDIWWEFLLGLWAFELRRHSRMVGWVRSWCQKFYFCSLWKLQGAMLKKPHHWPTLAEPTLVMYKRCLVNMKEGQIKSIGKIFEIYIVSHIIQSCFSLK